VHASDAAPLIFYHSHIGKQMSRIKRGGALAALGVAVVGGFEGLRLTAYKDAVGVPTICFGETRGVRMGMVKTKAECDAMLIKGLGEFADGIERCVPSVAVMPDPRYIAHLSLAWNIGVGGYCKSSIARLENAGHTVAACDSFLKYNRAGGVVFPGLTRRREKERALCLRDAPFAQPQTQPVPSAPSGSPAPFIIILFAAIAGGVFFFIRRKKKKG
jgi:lysozyme